MADFVYPPFTLFAFGPLSLLPPRLAYAVWDIACAALFTHAARPYLKGAPLLLPIALPASFVCADFGQSGLVFGALWLYAFRGYSWAAALLTFKPHLGALAAFRYMKPWRPLAVLVALAIASQITFGGWDGFLAQVVGNQTTMLHKGRFITWILLGVTPLVGYPWWGWLFYAVAGGVLVSRNFNVWTAATAALLISPYGFHYDMPVATLGMALLMIPSTGWRFALLGVGVVSPILVGLIGAWFIPPILLAVLWVQVSPQDDLRMKKSVSAESTTRLSLT
jgi:hypothetical protein